MTQDSLFPDLQSDAAPQTPTDLYASVAIERSLDRTLDYGIPPSMAMSLRVGQRVRVPLGRANRTVHGYVVQIKTATDCKQVKKVLAIDDARVLLTDHLLQLARWISRYYCCPLGTVLESVIPSAVKKRIGLGYTTMVRLVKSREQVQALLEVTRAPKRRAILSRLLLVQPGQPVELLRLAQQARATPPTVRKLAKAGFISLTDEPDFASVGKLPTTPTPTSEQPIQLNEDQQHVYNELTTRAASGGFSVNLLHGVTGSGKTEIYLQCIRDVVAKGKRAIVLVPEIALTPQTARRFTNRLPRVAVMHSGLPASVRHAFWQQIARGDANVVVGARSAIFAPLPDLGIIVVDEEHEASYKQDSAPRYHARDVAIKRAQIENVPVILGSATPSMESWWRAQKTVPPAENRIYHLLSLPRRVRNLALPTVELVDMKREIHMHRPAVHLISQRLSHLLRTTVNDGRQAIFLLNRRGYANYICCSSCGFVAQCKYCDTTMTYHRSAGVSATGAHFEHARHTGQLHCHTCLAVNPLPDKCPDCGKKLSLFGMGTQRIEEELARRFPDVKYARVDADTMRCADDYREVFGRFERREIHVLLGTQMIAKGLDYPNVTLVGVISGDTALALPDFRAAERTFALITQVAGRAGRGDAPGRVIVQTFIPDDPTIQAALRQDYVAFANRELQARRDVGLPPAVRMVRIVLRDEDRDNLLQQADKIAASLLRAMQHHSLAHAHVSLKGPMPCAVSRIAGYQRAQLLLFGKDPSSLQRLLAIARDQKAFADTDRVAVDVDPVALL